MKVLLLNAGSSSLKCTLMDARDGRVLATSNADWAGATTRYRYERLGVVLRKEDAAWRGPEEAVRQVGVDLRSQHQAGYDDTDGLLAVGHRIVHGGRFTASVPVNAETRSQIRDQIELAPLHNPQSLAALESAEQEFPAAQHIAVFDTSFHSMLPRAAYTYPIPMQWTQDWGIRRYGFHGLSHDYCSRRAAEMLDRSAAGLRLVICHLGHGCSVSAVESGTCVDTTMGFTPLEGLMMATRCGSIDPSILLYVQQKHGLAPGQLDEVLNRQSGLLGVSGVSADMREIVTCAHDGHANSQLALEMYARRVRQAIGGFAVTLGGIEALVFTAGVGENSAEVRGRIASGLECLGIEIDRELNASSRPDCDVSRSSSKVRILLIATREDLTMYREVLRVHERFFVDR